MNLKGPITHSVSVVYSTLGDFILNKEEDGPPLNDVEDAEFGNEFGLKINKTDRLNGFSFTIHGLNLFVANHWSVQELETILDNERSTGEVRDDQGQDDWFNTLFYEKVMTDDTIMPALTVGWRQAGIEEGERRKQREVQRVLGIGTYHG